jgi:hypothetical protein
MRFGRSLHVVLVEPLRSNFGNGVNDVQAKSRRVGTSIPIVAHTKYFRYHQDLYLLTGRWHGSGKLSTSMLRVGWHPPSRRRPRIPRLCGTLCSREYRSPPPR